MKNRQIACEVLSQWIAQLGYAPDPNMLMLLEYLILEALKMKDKETSESLTEAIRLLKEYLET